MMMKKIKSLKLYLLLGLPVIIAISLAFSRTLQEDYSTALKQKKQGINWEGIKSLPIQKGGRVMPLDSFARVLLTQFSGKSSVKFKLKSKKKVPAVKWLVKTVFERSTDDYPIFLIENPRIMEAIQVDYKKDRDWYSYSVLSSKVETVHQYAAQANQVEQEKRNVFQDQIIRLSNNLHSYEALRNSLVFWLPMQDLVGIDLFYTEVVQQLNKIRVENPNMNEKLRTLIHQIITFPYSKKNGLSIETYLKQLIWSLQIFKQFGVTKGVQTVESIIQSVDNKAHTLSNGLLSIIPPQERLITFLDTVDKSKGESSLSKEEEEEFKAYIMYCLQNKILEKTGNRSYKLTQAGQEGFKNVDREWKAPWAVLSDVVSDRDRDSIDSLNALKLVYNGFNRNDIPSINDGITQLKKFNDESLQATTTEKISLEVQYNRFDPLFWSIWIYLVSAIFCLLSWLKVARKPLMIVSVIFLVLAYIMHSYGITLRMIIKERPPVSTLYESIVFAAWVGVTLAMLMEYFSKASKSVSLFTGAASGYILMAIAARYANDGDNMAVLVAVLDSNFWLSTHVTSMIIGYSACLVSGAIGHIYILMHTTPNYNQKQVKEVGKLIYGTLCFGTIVAFLGTILGGLWADQSWGRFWGWDPKENGAMLIVLWSVVLLHARLGGYIKDWGLALGAVFGNIVVAAAWWGVNLLSVGLHNYGFTKGLFLKLAAFTVIELAFIAFGIGLWYHKKAQKATKQAT